MYIKSLSPWCRILEKLMSIGWLRNSPCFMEHHSSLLSSQETITYMSLWSPVNQFSAFPFYFFKINFNAILSLVHTCTKSCLSFKFTYLNPVCISLFLHICLIPCPLSLNLKFCNCKILGKTLPSMEMSNR